MSRSSEGRGSEGRGAFNRGSGAAAVAAAGPGVSPKTAIRIARSAEETRTRVIAHGEKHQARWTSRRYGELLAKAGSVRGLTPNGLVSDPKAKLMAQASASVGSKQAQRLARVEQAKARMLRTGQVRTGRIASAGIGLGD